MESLASFCISFKKTMHWSEQVTVATTIEPPWGQGYFVLRIYSHKKKLFFLGSTMLNLLPFFHQRLPWSWWLLQRTPNPTCLAATCRKRPPAVAGLASTRMPSENLRNWTLPEFLTYIQPGFIIQQFSPCLQTTGMKQGRKNDQCNSLWSAALFKCFQMTCNEKSTIMNYTYQHWDQE